MCHGIGNHHHHHHHHGVHGHHHHHNQCGQNNFNNAREDFGNALQDFSQGNIFGGLQHIGEGLSHLQNPFGFI